jgi:hypothetical protein
LNKIQTASRQSPPEHGQQSITRAVGISRHNPIHRWWGGTELTSDRLWRWDPANRALIAP